MGGHAMNYDFGPKRHWRRWVWNRIAERVARPSDAIVMYLPGADDHDRPVALGKGFVGSNLIGVERHKETRDHLRDANVLTVDADFFAAIDASGKASRLDVVYADLCSGISQEQLWALVRWVSNPNLRSAVFVFNLLRGREIGANNELRRAVQDAWDFKGPDGIERHRGVLLATAMIEEFSTWDADQQMLIQRASYMARQMDAAAMSYRSTANQTFDTIVFRNPFRDLDMGGLRFGEAMASYNDLMTGHYAKPAVSKASRSVAAVKAIRTMRERGTFPTR